MKLVAQVKLCPTPEQALLLRQTLDLVNRACNYISQRAWETKTFGRFALQREVYREVRARFPLAAQAIIRSIAKVCDSYQQNRQHPCHIKPRGAIAYDDHILNWRLQRCQVSIWCLGGRQKMAFICGSYQRDLLTHRKGESDLVSIGQQFFLYAVCDLEEPLQIEVTDVLGVDLGVKNLAADSDGQLYSSAQLNALRKRNRRLRAKLQAKGTRSARRLLRKRSRREQRFAANVNHVISKRLVAKAQGTGRGIALEDLKGIQAGFTARRSQRDVLYSWSFHQLRTFITYKAQRLGVPVVLVDPRYTSSTCPACGHVDKANRKSQSAFACAVCGFSGHADRVASVNIRARGRAAVNQPNVACN